MKAMKRISGIVSVFVVAPIWYYLVHWMLVKSNAGDLQMFLFWVYLPFGIFVSILNKLVEAEK